jgi:hypothetical protein
VANAQPRRTEEEDGKVEEGLREATATPLTMAAATAIQALGPLDQLDASLDDFAPSIGSPSSRHHTTTNSNNNQHLPFGYPSAHSGFRSDDTASEPASDSDSEASAGGYSPPAWRRLGNGDRSSGFWRKGDDLMRMLGGEGNDEEGGESRCSRESSPDYESADEILAQAIRTRLPAGSVSPDKERSPEPAYYPAQQHLIDEVVNAKRESDGDDMVLGGTKKDGVGDNCMFK